MANSILKIAVGTTSPQKIDYLNEIITEIGIKAELFSVDVKSGVSDQPVSEDETQKGSVNRAKAAFKEKPESNFGIGMEVGYHKNKNSNYEMFCCTSIVNKDDFVQSCFSSRFLLPKFHQEVLKRNKPLGEYVRKYKENVDEPITNYVRELVRGRKPLIIEATRNAILTYLASKNSI